MSRDSQIPKLSDASSSCNPAHTAVQRQVIGSVENWHLKMDFRDVKDAKRHVRAGERLGAGRLDFRQAIGQDGGENLAICRSPSSEPASLRRTRSRAPGRTQSLNGAPLRSAPGLRANTGT